MDLDFLNGTERQREIVRAALASLMHLNLDNFPISVEVEFVANPDPASHNEFAFTMSAGNAAAVSIRDDFPHFAPVEQYGSVAFANETVIHEFGHALLDVLPLEAQEELATMFRTTPDDWSPANTAWEDRPLEGIVETFKDAFLPADLREYFNRTHHAIDIDRYPDYRRVWRTEADAVSFDLLGDLTSKWPDRATFTTEVDFSAAGGQSIPVAQDQTLVYEFPLDLDDFIAPNAFAPWWVATSLTWEFLAVVNGIEVEYFRGGWSRYSPTGTPFFTATGFAYEAGAGSFFPLGLETHNISATDEVMLGEDAIALGMLPTVVSHSIAAEAGDLVSVSATAFGVVRFSNASGLAGTVELDEIGLKLPVMLYSVGGVAEEIPRGEVVPAEARSGRIRAKNKVMGH